MGDKCRHIMLVVVAGGLQYQVCKKCALQRIHNQENQPVELHPAYGGGPLSPVWERLSNPQRHAFYIRYLDDIMADVARISQGKAMQIWGIKSTGTMYDLTRLYKTRTGRSPRESETLSETFPLACERRRTEYVERLEALGRQRAALDGAIKSCQNVLSHLEELIKVEGQLESKEVQNA